MIKQRIIGGLAGIVVGMVDFSYAEESLQTLLDSYRRESDLSYQTKKENTGHVVVYTRDDLERMQIHRLADILKELRFVPYRVNTFGMHDPLHIDPFFFNSDTLKVYVNDHEISSSFSGGGLQFYGNVDMEMFDHVEIYYGAPIFDIATEPSSILIKLYTKEPSRENGGKVTARVGERGMQEMALYHAQAFEKWRYFAYMEESERHKKKTTHEVGGQTFDISQDYSQKHLFLDLQSKSNRLELEFLGQTHDPFSGQSLMITPSGGDWKQPMIRASFSRKDLNEKLYTTLSYIHSKLEMDIVSAGPLWGQLLPKFQPSYIPFPGKNRMRLEVKGGMFTAGTHYETPIENHLLKVGLEYRNKEAELEEYRFNWLGAPKRTASINIYSIYAQDQIALRDNMTLAFSSKYNYYNFERQERDRINESLRTWQGRVAFSTILDQWRMKTFYTHMEFPTQLYTLVLHDYKFDAQKQDALSAEVHWVGTKNNLRFLASYSWFGDILLLDPASPSRPSDFTDFKALNTSIDLTHSFSADDRCDINVNWNKVYDNTYSQFKDHYLSGFVRILNSLEKVDIYNEIIYREKNNFTDTGWNYSAGLIYHATPDLKFSIKGVDLFEKARKNSFLWSPAPGRIETLNLPVVGRQVYVSMEWLF